MNQPSQILATIRGLNNADLRALSFVTDHHGRPTQAATLAGHQFSANRLATRAAKPARLARDPLLLLRDARYMARRHPSPAAWMAYGEKRQAAVSPLSVVLP